MKRTELISMIREVSISGKTYEEYVEAVADRLLAEGELLLISDTKSNNSEVKSNNSVRGEKYKEILKLHTYCEKTGVECRLESLFDGYAIRFNNGGDFIQHRGSYGCTVGCVEPAIGSRLDYTAVPLKNAIDLVRRHKDKLNKTVEGNEKNEG